MLQELEFQVLELYDAADRAIARYRQATGLSCPAGCVRCCDSEKVEATTAEMIPLAVYLFQSCQAELLIKRLEKEESKECILFRPDLSTPEAGGCSQYPLRPLVCRLFGYSGSHDRQGTAQLAKCREMIDLPSPQLLDKAVSLMPRFTSYGVAISALHPSLGTRRLPINEALHQALLKVAMVLAYSSEPAPTDTGIDLPPDAPLNTPAGPRRKAA